MSQTLVLKPGWNGVFLHVDASYAGNNFTTILGAGSPITAIAMWNPPTTAQFVGSPSSPVTGTGWNTWTETGQLANNTLASLPGDTAYLFYNSSASTNTITITGQPVTPRNHWDVSGLNFLGFSTVPGTIQTPPVPSTTVLNFQNYLSTSTELTNSSLTELYEYMGGEISTNNPMLMPSYLFPGLPVVRGQAYWIRQGTTFSHYFGPFEVILSSSGGVNFSTNGNTYTFTLRNHTVNHLTVSMNLAASLAQPAGVTNIVSYVPPPLILQGALNTTTLQYASTAVIPGTPATFALAPANTPGSDVQVVLGLNRSAITAPPWSTVAGILSFKDSLGFTEIDVPTTAIVGSDAGLWIGTAAITNVTQYLNTFELDGNGDPVMTTNGSYIVTAVNTNPAPTVSAFSQRLIVFNPSVNAANSDATLLQRVYYGMDANTNAIVSTGESALNPNLFAVARRISAVNFPWSVANQGWPFSGNLQTATPTAPITVTVTNHYDDQASNPFLHTYHPDHDNLNHQSAAPYSTLAPGVESYNIVRTITLTPSAPAANFSTLTAGNNSISGNYAELITLLGIVTNTPNGNIYTNTRSFSVAGIFSLNHISPIATLNTQSP